jgi:hypothetical protein
MDLPLPEAPADPVAQARLDRSRFLGALLISLGFVTLLWWIKLLEVWLGQSLLRTRRAARQNSPG